MPRPGCRRHPNSRVKRVGYYGKRKEFVRYRCVPANGDPPHYLNRNDRTEPMRVKLVGGRTGACDECERTWHSEEGLPSADYDKFILRAKAKALVDVAYGSLSMRGAAHEVRIAEVERRTGSRPMPGAVSRDGRMARDWVPQYTEILAEKLLPTEWPRAIAVDSFDVRVKGWKADGTPKQKGRFLYSVFGAAGYQRFYGHGQLWHLRAMRGESERDWREFFRSLPGSPEVVICDGSVAIRKAAEWAFPRARIYPCTWHLQETLRRHVQRAGLYNRRRAIYRALRVSDQDLFWYPHNWEFFLRIFERYERAAPADPGIQAIRRWIERNREQIELVLTSPHWPRDLKLLEEHLATVRDRLGERKRLFRNPYRLNCVLRLFLMQLRGACSLQSWARILRENHKRHRGNPPPRRVYDGKRLFVPR